MSNKIDCAACGKPIGPSSVYQTSPNTTFYPNETVCYSDYRKSLLFRTKKANPYGHKFPFSELQKHYTSLIGSPVGKSRVQMLRALKGTQFDEHASSYAKPVVHRKSGVFGRTRTLGVTKPKNKGRHADIGRMPGSGTFVGQLKEDGKIIIQIQSTSANYDRLLAAIDLWTRGASRAEVERAAGQHTSS